MDLDLDRTDLENASKGVIAKDKRKKKSQAYNKGEASGVNWEHFRSIIVGLFDRVCESPIQGPRNESNE